MSRRGAKPGRGPMSSSFLSWSFASPLFLLSFLLLLLPALLGAERPAGLADVIDVRTWSHPDYTRVVVELSAPLELDENQLTRLAADPGAKRSARLYLDLPQVWVGKRLEQGVPVGDGLLEAVRLGQFNLTTSRLVIDLERYARHRLLILQSPDRIVVDVYGSPENGGRHKADSRGARAGPTTKETAAAPGLSLLTRPVRTVVIDAGHGGKDPGATGYGGLREKDLNLRLARRLARRLEARSFRVVMTREDDRFLSLEDRTVVAESSGGDVFVSIHANASRNRKARGIETYYLNENHERHSLDVAARENGIERKQVDSLQRVMARMRVSEVSGHSRELARTVHEDLHRGLAKDWGKAPDLGVKKGPFYVLFMTSMPAILIETGFVTNREDAKRLRDERYLDAMATQIAAGIERYRDGRMQRMAAEEAAVPGKTPPALPGVGARE